MSVMPQQQKNVKKIYAHSEFMLGPTIGRDEQDIPHYFLQLDIQAKSSCW